MIFHIVGIFVMISGHVDSDIDRVSWSRREDICVDMAY